ncbi:hypothetical protein [Bradyrhizobium stylosanthis]|uniref:hypothetical protein n=1 Tax=Bradyrhizobium stylosanthis TaxID=1803665 RepID=UPI0012E784AE|nr:hypothetical protein [Bradyrhizobium stylosanthis]
MPHDNERVELAYKILRLRHELRQMGWTTEETEKLRAEMERLLKELREIDE